MFQLSKRPSFPAVLLVLLASAQAQSQNDCTERRVVVNVRSRQGKFIDGLQPTSFRAVLRGQPIKILPGRVLADPPRVMMMLDVSGSVNLANHELQTARFMAANLLVLSAGHNVALALFSDHLVETFGFDRAPNEILQKITSLPEGRGPTALYDSLNQAINLFGSPQPGDVIYLISDGGNNAGKTKQKDVELALLSKGIRLFPFILSGEYLLSGGHFATEEESTGVSDLIHLAEVTGGSVVNSWQDPSAKGTGRLIASLSHAYDLMKNYYELQVVDVLPKLETERRWELWVADENGKRRKDVAIDYPRNLIPCSESSPNP